MEPSPAIVSTELLELVCVEWGETQLLVKAILLPTVLDRPSEVDKMRWVSHPVWSQGHCDGNARPEREWKTLSQQSALVPVPALRPPQGK